MPFRLIAPNIGSVPLVPATDWVSIAPPLNSTDFNLGGAHTSDNFGWCSVAVDPTDGSVMVGTCWQGLWKSSDQGATWAKLNTGTGGSLIDGGKIWSLAIDPFNHNTIWAAAGNSGNGPYKSTDGGVSWAAVTLTGPPATTTDPYTIKFDPYTADHVLVAWHTGWASYGGNSGVSETTDNGTTWTHYTPTTSPAWGIGGSACHFLDASNHWLMCSSDGGAWRTADNGATWTQVQSTNLTHGGSNNLTKIGSTYYLALEANIYYSTDVGVTWTATTGSGLITAGNYIACSIPDSSGNLYSARDFPFQSYQTGQCYKMASGGTSWASFGTQTFTFTDAIGPNGPNSNGPMCGAYDPVHHVAYAACYLGGVWKLTGV